MEDGFGTFSLSTINVSAIIYFLVSVRDREKQKKIYSYNRTIPIVSHFLTEQSQENSRCLLELKYKMITRALKDKRGVVSQSLRE